MTGEELREARTEMRIRPDAMAKTLGITLADYEDMEDSEEVPPAFGMATLYMVDHPEDRPRMHLDDVRVINAADIDFFGDPIFDGRKWGPWRLNRESLTLDLNSRVSLVDRDGDGAPIWERREDYYITLPEVTTAQGAVDWLGQIAGKGWGAPTLGHLTQAFDDIFSFQGRFAHDPGFESMNAASAYLQQVIQPREDEELEARRRDGEE